MHEMQEIMKDISNTLLARTKSEKEKGVLDGKEEKSIIGVLSKSFGADKLGPHTLYLVKANDTDSAELHLTREEVLGQVSKSCYNNISIHFFREQMKLLLFAGYETTSSKYCQRSRHVSLLN